MKKKIEVKNGTKLTMDSNENPVTELVRSQNNGLLVGARFGDVGRETSASITSVPGEFPWKKRKMIIIRVRGRAVSGGDLDRRRG